MDNIIQKHENMKEELKIEKAKVKSLNEVIQKQNTIIETLKEKPECDTPKTRHHMRRCRY